MKEITASGQTVEAAVQSALSQLNTTEDRVDILVIDEGRRGLLGVFGSKRAVVKVTIKKTQVEKTEDFLNQMIENMGIDIDVVTTVHHRHVLFELSGEKIAMLIGKRGQTLNAIQYLVHLALNKGDEHYYTVTVDAEGYRARRKETLRQLAVKMADKALRLNRKVTLEPMPSFERKIIHTALESNHEIATFSDGIEPHRHIVIKP